MSVINRGELPEDYDANKTTRERMVNGKMAQVQDYRNPLAKMSQSKLDKITRTCLGCDRKFPSKSKFNKMCDPCKAKEIH